MRWEDGENKLERQDVERASTRSGGREEDDDECDDGMKRWIGHILRGDGLLREVMEGRIVGKRPGGRKRAK